MYEELIAEMKQNGFNFIQSKYDVIIRNNIIVELNLNSRTKSIDNNAFNLPLLKSLEVLKYYYSYYALPESIGNLSNLKRLYLYDNEFKSLPDSISNLSNLQELEISKHNLLHTVPEGLGNLTNLRKLDLQGNGLESLPDSLGDLTNLEDLNLRANGLKSLPENIGNLTHLKKLNLRSNFLSTLPESIGNLKNLKILDLRRNNLKLIPESIGNLVNLKELDLRRNELTSLPESIKNVNKLQELDFSYNKLTSVPECITNLIKHRDLTNWGYLGSVPEIDCVVGNHKITNAILDRSSEKGGDYHNGYGMELSDETRAESNELDYISSFEEGFIRVMKSYKNPWKILETLLDHVYYADYLSNFMVSLVKALMESVTDEFVQREIIPELVKRLEEDQSLEFPNFNVEIFKNFTLIMEDIQIKRIISKKGLI